MAFRWTVLALLAILASTLPAQEVGWPREIALASGKLVLYQPQPEALMGTLLTARAAASFTRPGAEPVFGALWLTARVHTDRERREVLITDVAVTRIRWPNANPDVQERVSRIIEADFPRDGFHISLDRFTASMATAEREQKSLAGIRNDPPRLLFAESRAVLLLYDGEPQVRPMENPAFERVVNTPWAVMRDTRTDTWYLSGGKFWYSARSPMGPWQGKASPPYDLQKIMPPDTSLAAPPTVPPAVFVATEPAELIVSDGPPKWQSIPGGKLFYVQNAETPWFREVATNLQYLLISGRWFRSAAKEGPWEFVRADSLPAAFGDIAPGSAIGAVRASVAGTEEALDATLDLQVPQTAAIWRSEARLTVEYQGEPSFTPIAGTRVAWAENSATQVLRIEGAYYAVDNGVWFTSKAATGPWVVADSIPESDIQSIPPSEPVYNLTEVHIYESTDSVVYVGYTPGYLWSYPWYGVPIYGTGWPYRPWLALYFIPRAVTYGMAVRYNPWTGWGAGMAWSNGFFAAGAATGRWGGAYSTRPAPYGRSTNVYTRPEVVGRTAGQFSRDRASQQLRADRVAKGPNNVFADREGNVRRASGGLWEAPGVNGGWTRIEDAATQARRANPPPAARPANPPSVARPATPATRPAPSDLDRDKAARERGATRAAAAPRVAFRGGGRRR